MSGSSNSITSIRGRMLNGHPKGKERAFVRAGIQTTAILTGKEDLSLWEDEELRRGQKRDKNGKWQGAAPKIIPRAVHDELVRRTLSAAEKLLRESLDDAIKMLVEIAKDPAADDKARVRAIDMIMNRVMGKEPNKIELSGQSKWEVALLAGIVSVSDE